MRYKSITLVACFVGIVAGCGSAKDEAPSSAQKSGVVENAPWKRFSPKGGNFSLLMPGVPTETVSINNTVVGPLKDHSFMLKAIQGKYKAGYLISYVDYPKEKRGVLSDAEILEFTLQPTEDDNKGRMVYKKKIKIQGHEGTEYQYKGKIQTGHIVTGRNFLINNRLLLLTAVMPKEQFEKGDAMKYLDSLELTTQK